MYYDHDDSDNPLNKLFKLNKLFNKRTEIELEPKEDEAFLEPIIGRSDVDLDGLLNWIQTRLVDYRKLKLPPKVLDYKVSSRLAEVELATSLIVDYLAEAMGLEKPFTQGEIEILEKYGLYKYFVPQDPVMLYMQISEKYLEEMQQANIEETLVRLQEHAFWKLRYAGIKVQLCTHKDNWTPVTFESDCNLNESDRKKFEDMAYDAVESALKSGVSQKVQVIEDDRVGFRRALEVFRAQAKG
ncbi:MAG: hypothetical protein KGO49_14075 [Gammaproteobacteria bacterium]|nr:hypothetical protein [Gammaproteobacteria bacterium]